MGQMPTELQCPKWLIVVSTLVPRAYLEIDDFDLLNGSNESVH